MHGANHHHHHHHRPIARERYAASPSRTLSADFFAGADALVRRAEISVLIFFEDWVCLEATRAPVKDEVNMVSSGCVRWVCANGARGRFLCGFFVRVGIKKV